MNLDEYVCNESNLFFDCPPICFDEVRRQKRSKDSMKYYKIVDKNGKEIGYQSPRPHISYRGRRSVDRRSMFQKDRQETVFRVV